MPLDPKLKDAWLKEFRLNGFLVLRSFLPRDLVEGMYEQLLPIARGELERVNKGDARSQRGTMRLSFDLRTYIKLLEGPLADERYTHHPVIEDLVEAILGPPSSWGRGWTRVECVWTGSEFMSWHSDQVLDETPEPQSPNRAVRLTYNIPLVDFTWANGATEFIPGSHLQPRSLLAEGVHDVPNLHFVRLDLRRGDAVLRDGNTLHRGTPNLTDVPRLMLDQTYRTALAGRETRG